MGRLSIQRRLEFGIIGGFIGSVASAILLTTFIDIIRERFNSGVKYKGRVLKWDTVIQEKTNELGRYLNGRLQRLDFSEPAPVLERTDNRAIREVILSLTQSQARKRGIGKNTLHYLRKHARTSKPFKIYNPVSAKLGLRESLTPAT